MVFVRDRRLKNKRPTATVCSNGTIQNAAQTLLANIRFSEVDNPVRTIAVTSSIPNEGKTTVAIALAIAIGKSGGKCLLVEADMRRRSLNSVLNLRPRYGLHRLLTGACTYQEAIAETSFKNVSFLDAEPGIPSPGAILSSKHFSQLLDKLAQHFHFIIIDTPPVTAFADAAIIASVVDGTVLVSQMGYTSKREVERGAEQLKASGGNLLGVVLNVQKGKSGSSYDYNYYYDYYADYYADTESASHASSKPTPRANKLQIPNLSKHSK